MTEVRVRFAPSPTGNLHIGGARTALFNWLFARHHGGRFILRLEDTDTERFIPEAAQGILTTLRWLGLDWDEGPDKGGPYGPYRQSERLELYRREAARLVEQGLAYPCYCTLDELAAMREEARKAGRAPRYEGRCCKLTEAERRALEAEGRRPVLRIRVPEGTTVVRDLVRGEVSFDNHAVMDDFIIMKSNGIATYNFACVIDDAAMRISHVIRAEEHLSNTPKQMVVFAALGYPLPEYAHVPMILAPDRSKLSKRHGATAVEEFRDQGYLAEAIINYLALLGWSPGDENEVMSRAEILTRFSLDAVSKHAAIYDVKKLTWLNAQYLGALPLDEVVERARPFFQARGLIGDKPGAEEMTYLRRVIDAVRSRVHTLAELAEASSYFFSDEFDYEEKGVRKHFMKPGVADILARGRQALADVECFDLESAEAAYRKVIEDLGVSGGTLIHPTRLALSGRTVGPGLFDIISVLGRERCLARLDRAIRCIETCNPEAHLL
ncbi:MAG: glutamate--tRNA ligase [Thermoanaerobacterales bacterium]|nr:glutamate--tRNA ligase [Thermoanaerobacterales bacterium]